MKRKNVILINTLMYDKFHNSHDDLSFLEMNEKVAFYYHRLCALHNYSLFQAREIVKMICRCAFNDSLLTDNQSIVIIEICLSSKLDDFLMEVNFNAGW